MKSIFYSLVAGVVLLTGCVIAPGSHEGSIPPKLSIIQDGKIWENVGSFGPVPVSLAAKGAVTCSALNTKDAKFTAKGYHSKAQDVDGKPFAEGGFYCVQG